MYDKKYYQEKFISYPDLITSNQFQEMLEGCNIKTVQGIIWRKEVMALKVENKYLITKESAIEYLTSDTYQLLLARREIAKSAVISPKDIELNRQKILLFCNLPRTRQELMLLTGVKSKKTFFRVYLHPLLESGDLKMTVPGQPSNSTQKYIRVIRY